MDDKLLDRVLTHFYENKEDDIIPFNIKEQFTDISEDVFYKAVRYLHRDSYLKKTSKWNIARPENNLYKISDEGIDFVEDGGYAESAIRWQKDSEERQEIKNLELQKLRADVGLITNQLLDYEKTKKQAKDANRIAIFALFLTAIGLMLQYSGCKIG